MSNWPDPNGETRYKPQKLNQEEMVQVEVEERVVQCYIYSASAILNSVLLASSLYTYTYTCTEPVYIHKQINHKTNGNASLDRLQFLLNSKKKKTVVYLYHAMMFEITDLFINV